MFPFKMGMEATSDVHNLGNFKQEIDLTSDGGAEEPNAGPRGSRELSEGRHASISSCAGAVLFDSCSNSSRPVRDSKCGRHMQVSHALWAEAGACALTAGRED